MKHLAGASGGTARARAVAAEFNEKAGRFETDRLAPWYMAQASLVLSHLGRVQGPILDVGCGTGWFIRSFVKENPGERAIGVDLSPAMVAEARRRAEGANLTGTEFVTADWEDPGIEEKVRRLLPEGAAAVVCISSLHYFRDPAAALGSMVRVMAAGGQLLLVERSRDRAPLTSLWDLLHRRVIRDHVQFYREIQLLDLMTEAGLSDVRAAARVRRWLWKGKLFTSLVLLEGSVSHPPPAVTRNQSTAGEANP
jgi:SAM-dependent methyltransferase